MAILRKSLLGLTTACIVSGGASAQDDPKALVKQAWRLVMTGKKAEAKPFLEKVLALDPSNDEAYKLYQSVDKDIWFELLLTQGDIGKIAKSIVDRSAVAAKAMSRDEDAIKALVEKAVTGDHGERIVAARTLAAKHGEFAVPALIEKLGDHDDAKGSLKAIMTLADLGSRSTLPLIEALASSNATLRRNIASVFNQTRDHRAIPALTGLLKDENEGVVSVAQSALRSMGADVTADPVALHLNQSQNYLVGIGTQGMDLSDVVWSFADGKLIAKDCNAAVYGFELAKKAAEKALGMDPSSEKATTLVARSYLAQCAAIDTAGLESLQGVRSNLNMVAMAMGPSVLDKALQESLRDNQPYVAVAAIEALGSTIDRDGIEKTALGSALDSGNKMVAYAAALAVTKASRASSVPMADKVVAVLARGVAEQALTRVATVGFGGDVLSAMQKMGNDKAGVVVEANFAGVKTTTGQLFGGSVRPDAIIINKDLPDGTPTDIIGLIGDNDRLKDIRVFVVGGEETPYEGKDNVQVVEASLSGDDLRAKVLESVKEISDKLGARAAKVAMDSSKALQHLATNRVDISAAVSSLASELTREDAVAIPAAVALGEGASNITPLVTALAGEGSLELKVACAEAAGKILGRVRSLSAEHFAAMKKLAAQADADAKLRTAVTAALGKAELSPAQKLELVQALSTAAVAGD